MQLKSKIDKGQILSQNQAVSDYLHENIAERSQVMEWETKFNKTRQKKNLADRKHTKRILMDIDLD